MRLFKKVAVHGSALLTVMLLASPFVAHTFAYNNTYPGHRTIKTGVVTGVPGTGKLVNVTASTNASITLSSGYLTIDGATAFNFINPATGSNAQITPKAITLTTFTAGDSANDTFVSAARNSQ